jgi:hypothetical protein
MGAAGKQAGRLRWQSGSGAHGLANMAVGLLECI